MSVLSTKHGIDCSCSKCVKRNSLLILGNYLSESLLITKRTNLPEVIIEFLKEALEKNNSERMRLEVEIKREKK